MVNLLDIAEPTAAVREHREEYTKVIERLWSLAEGGASD